jgi:hypothetical protein
VGWLRRHVPAETPVVEETQLPAAIVRPAPGIAALFRGLARDEGRSLLDLGSAAEPNLRFYSRFARRLRFAGLLDEPPLETMGASLEALSGHPEHPYDTVLAWNLLDRVVPEQRALVVERLVGLTSRGAHVHLMVNMSEEPFTTPFRFTLLEDGRVRQEAIGIPRPAWSAPLPAEVERLLDPLRIVHAFVLRSGMREYVAVRPREEA